LPYTSSNSSDAGAAAAVAAVAAAGALSGGPHVHATAWLRRTTPNE